jgi:DNA-binding NtrC family response regulator
MPDINGLDVLQMIKRDFRDLPVVIISGHATIDITVQAMKLGALNLYTKPMNTKDLVKELDVYFGTTERHLSEDEEAGLQLQMISKNTEMQKIMEMCDAVAATTATVLITGESGTGKELMANRIHMESDRINQPFFKINCATLPEDLLESQLFGHEKGAFTGATSEKIGFFELASKGTILLDEIAELTPKTQGKLLRVLQEKEFIRVGGTKVLHTDARIISATNIDMQTAICNGTFREDIYYRLSVVNIHLPPLRERREDILPLVEFFIDQFATKYKKKIRGIDNGLQDILLKHAWPGNIRELKNLIERSIIFSKKPVLSLEGLPPHYREQIDSIDPGIDAENYFDNLSRENAKEILLEALERSQGKKTEAARLLKISRKTLYNRLRKYGLD